MAIGQGKGENKALQAIEQALHHPLLGEIALENAAGLIVNFTGGADLTLSEVENALCFLQTRTGQETETVMGIITDNQMHDRVQVILVVTGLGSPTLEEAMQNVNQTVTEYKPGPPPAIKPPIQQPVKRSESFTLPAYFDEGSVRMQPGKSDYLDVPAFLRRRVVHGS